MHSRSVKDKLHRDQVGQWVRLPDDIPANVVAINDMLEAVVSSYDDTHKVAVLTGPPQQLPSGTPDVSSVTKAFNKYNLEINESDTIIAIHDEGVYDDTGTHATYGQVDWVIFPTTANAQMRIVLIDGTSGGQVSGDPVAPIEVNGNDTRIYSGTLESAGDIWVRVNDHQRRGRLWQPKNAAYKALLSGVYDPNAFDSESFPDPDERPLYSIDPESDGEVLARVTTEASAADWSTPSDPVESTNGRCTTYFRTENGATTEDETGVTFYNYFDSAIPVGTIIFLEEFQGRLVCTQVVASGLLIAKLTATVPKRTSDNYGTLGSVSLGHLVAGVWTEVLTGQTVWNPALNPVHIPSGETIQIPVGYSNGHWVLQNPTDLQQVKNFSTGGPQLIMHCGSTEYEWKDYDPIVDLRLDGYNFQYDTICDTWQTWHTGEECEEE